MSEGKSSRTVSIVPVMTLARSWMAFLTTDPSEVTTVTIITIARIAESAHDRTIVTKNVCFGKVAQV